MEASTTKKYIDETTTELIDNYKDLIKKTFIVTDKDLLQEKLDSDADEETEDKYLNAIKKRRVALDEVDLMLEKITKLEVKLSGPKGEEEIKNPAKKHSKQ